MASVGYLLSIIALIAAILVIILGYLPKSEPQPAVRIQSPVRPEDVIIDEEDLLARYCSVVAIQGRRPAMEDTFSHILSEQLHSFGVYDGHGSERVSIYLRRFLLERIHEKLKLSNIPKAEVLKETFLEINSEYQKTANAYKTGGSTAVVGIIYKEEDIYKLTVANTGDSRSIFCCREEGKDYPMSYDHKPDNPAEKTRIEKSGGYITKGRVARVNGVLATSRAFGDFELAPQVIADPDIIEIELGKLSENGKFITTKEQWQDNILIIASDGFWDVFTNAEAASYASKARTSGRSANDLANLFVKTAYERGSMDNITVFIIYLDTLLHNHPLG